TVVRGTDHESVAGSYWPPVFRIVPLYPPQTIIFCPVQTAECSWRPAGAPSVEDAAQLSTAGSYKPPELVSPPAYPPQTIILFTGDPAHTAVWNSRAAGAPVVEVAVHVSPLGS